MFIFKTGNPTIKKTTLLQIELKYGYSVEQNKLKFYHLTVTYFLLICVNDIQNYKSFIYEKQHVGLNRAIISFSLVQVNNTTVINTNTGSKQPFSLMKIYQWVDMEGLSESFWNPISIVLR